jgi:hypothetical protein
MQTPICGNHHLHLGMLFENSGPDNRRARYPVHARRNVAQKTQIHIFMQN